MFGASLIIHGFWLYGICLVNYLPPLFLGVQGYVLQLEGWLTGILIVCGIIINHRLYATLPGGTVPRRCNSTTADSLQGAFGSEAGDVNPLPNMPLIKIPSMKLAVRP